MGLPAAEPGKSGADGKADVEGASGVPDPAASRSEVATAAARSRGRAHAWAVGGLSLAVLVACGLTWVVVNEAPRVLAFDESLTRWVRSWADAWGWPVTVSWLVGILAGPLLASVYAVAAVLAIGSTGRRAAALLLASSSLLGVLMAEVLKRAVARQRPPGAEAYESGMWRSFPSGHSMAGIYIYLLSGVLFVLLGRALGHRRALVGLGWALVVCGPLIGVSRLVLGVHWPSDIVAGWAFGSIAALSCSLLLWDPVARGWARPITTPPTQAAPGGAAQADERGEPPAG